MRILQIGSSLQDWGGIERYLVYLGQSLAERGHDVWTIAPRNSPLDYRLVGVTKVPMTLPGQFRFDALPRFVRFLRKHSFDVVNAHFSPDFVVPALAAKITRQPCRVLTRHVVLPWAATKVRRYSRLFTNFIGVSEAVSKVLVSSGIPADRVQYVHAGIPTLVPGLPREVTRGQLNLTGFALGFFGRLVPEKGVQTLIEASKKLPQNTVHIFGDGPLMASLKEQKTPAVFHGRVTEIGDAMSAMDAIVIPSLWEEAFPFSALEAMSLGKPIIGTNSGGIPEQVVHGKTGFLFEKGDVPGLVKLTNQFIKDPGLAPQMGLLARERHNALFNLPTFGESMERAYSNAVHCSS